MIKDYNLEKLHGVLSKAELAYMNNALGELADYFYNKTKFLIKESGKINILLSSDEDGFNLTAGLFAYCMPLKSKNYKWSFQKLQFNGNYPGRESLRNYEIFETGSPAGYESPLHDLAGAALMIYDALLKISKLGKFIHSIEFQYDSKPLTIGLVFESDVKGEYDIYMK